MSPCAYLGEEQDWTREGEGAAETDPTSSFVSSILYCFYDIAYFQEGQSYPVIHLHLNKSVHTYDEYAGNLDYDELMNFIAMQTK